MKKIFSLTLCLALALCLAGCYDVPDGYKRTHHTYQSVLAYAKAIDPDATVLKEYTDMTDEWQRVYRQWDAVINGVDCHILSVSALVWNKGVAAGEFANEYYRITTDYDCVILKTILDKSYPDWKVRDDLIDRADEDAVYVEFDPLEYKMLSDGELEQLWQTACNINAEYQKQSGGKSAVFGVPSPGKYWDNDDEWIVKQKTYQNSITEFTDENKQTFFKRYYESWALLQSEA